MSYLFNYTNYEIAYPTSGDTKSLEDFDYVLEYPKYGITAIIFFADHFLKVLTARIN